MKLSSTAVCVIVGCMIGVVLAYGIFAVIVINNGLINNISFTGETEFTVKTKDETNGLISCYEVDAFGNSKGTDRVRFEPNCDLKINLENASGDWNKDCKSFKCSKATLDRIYKAMRLVKNYEEHDIHPQRAFVKNDTIYISAWYNVNLSCPWYLFRYEEKDNKVVQLFSFIEEEILDIRI